MGENTSFIRVAQTHVDDLIRLGGDPAETLSAVEAAARFLAAEGQPELAQAIRQVVAEHRQADLQERRTG